MVEPEFSEAHGFSEAPGCVSLVSGQGVSWRQNRPCLRADPEGVSGTKVYVGGRGCRVRVSDDPFQVGARFLPVDIDAWRAPEEGGAECGGRLVDRQSIPIQCASRGAGLSCPTESCWPRLRRLGRMRPED